MHMCDMCISVCAHMFDCMLWELAASFISCIWLCISHPVTIPHVTCVHYLSAMTAKDVITHTLMTHKLDHLTPDLYQACRLGPWMIFVILKDDVVL